MAHINNAYKLQPVYEAMSLCSLAEIEVKQRETQKKRLQTLRETLAAERKVIEASFDADLLKRVSQSDIQLSVVLLNLLARATRNLVDHVRGTLGDVSHQFKNDTESVLNRLEDCAEKIEQIAEAWMMALNTGLMDVVRSAVASIMKRENKELPNWREALVAMLLGVRGLRRHLEIGAD